MDPFIQVRKLQAKTMTRKEYNDMRGWPALPNENPEDPGYYTADTKGHFSWFPKDIYESQNLPIAGKDNTICQEDVDNMIAYTYFDTLESLGSDGLTTIMVCTLVNGFTITESSSCVDPANYSVEVGAEICMKKIKDKIWFLLGFLLQSGLYGFKKAKV